MLPESTVNNNKLILYLSNYCTINIVGRLQYISISYAASNVRAFNASADAILAMGVEYAVSIKMTTKIKNATI